MWRRAVSGQRAVAWRPLIYTKTSVIIMHDGATMWSRYLLQEE